LGIIADTPITHFARFNLMQIGQILQTLAVAPYEVIDEKLNDLYSQFDPVCRVVYGCIVLQNCLSRLLTQIVDGTEMHHQLDQMYATDTRVQALHRNRALCTVTDLTQMVCVSSDVYAHRSQLHFTHTHIGRATFDMAASERDELSDALRRLPAHLIDASQPSLLTTPPPSALARTPSSGAMKTPNSKKATLGKSKDKNS
jgi:hypothetical protein